MVTIYKHRNMNIVKSFLHIAKSHLNALPTESSLIKKKHRFVQKIGESAPSTLGNKLQEVYRLTADSFICFAQKL